ncbi:proline-rich proteoglycan 2-like [Melozone crissalis]|uniref:proline-rich proteoglycan 2-like n=1 Tax=Melozone crissalis TaxID=40204 RepID=UPI0023DC9ADB|nr:proline-rich proteoglycan 2-like [Melozone crissalis]
MSTPARRGALPLRPPGDVGENGGRTPLWGRIRSRCGAGDGGVHRERGGITAEGAEGRPPEPPDPPVPPHPRSQQPLLPAPPFPPRTTRPVMPGLKAALPPPTPAPSPAARPCDPRGGRCGRPPAPSPPPRIPPLPGSPWGPPGLPGAPSVAGQRQRDGPPGPPRLFRTLYPQQTRHGRGPPQPSARDKAQDVPAVPPWEGGAPHAGPRSPLACPRRWERPRPLPAPPPPPAPGRRQLCRGALPSTETSTPSPQPGELRPPKHTLPPPTTPLPPEFGGTVPRREGGPPQPEDPRVVFSSASCGKRPPLHRKSLLTARAAPGGTPPLCRGPSPAGQRCSPA